MARLVVEVVESGVAKADQDLAKLGRTAAQTEKSVNNVGGSFNKNRAIIQQFGFQLQDVVVTTRDAASGLTALGVQGGQLLSFVSPVAGTLLTIAGVAGGALLASLSGAEEKTSSLADAMAILDEQLDETENGAIRLSDSLTELANKNEQLARGELTRALVAATDAMAKLRQESEALIGQNLGGSFEDDAAAVRELAYQIEGIDAAGQDLFSLISKLQDADAFSPLADAAEELQENLGVTRSQSVELLRVLTDVAKNPTPEAFTRASVALEEMNKQTGFSNAGLLSLSARMSELAIGTVNAAERLNFIKGALGGFGQAVKAANDDIVADDVRRETERAQREAESARNRAQREAEQEARRLQIRQLSAAEMLQQIDRLGASESEKLDYWYTDQNARLAEALNERLITQQDYAIASELLTEELLNRQAQLEADANNKRRAAENQRTAEVKAQVEAQYEAEEKRKQAFQNSANAAVTSLSTITQALRDGGKEQSAAYRILFAAQQAAAIPSIITAAETGAAQALALGPIGIPISALIKGLGYASAGVVAGQAIAGARMQGGQVFAGQSYEVGERGREVFTPSTNGVISSSGGGAMAVNLKVIDNSTGSKTYSARQLTESDVELIIEDRVPRIMAREQADPYSQFAKAQRSTTSATRRL